MRKIRRLGSFKRDYRRGLSSVLGKRLEEMLREATDMLAADKPLPFRYADHALSGKWADCRDCHIRPDLVLIYREPDEATLELVRLRVSIWLKENPPSIAPLWRTSCTRGLLVSSRLPTATAS
jgi:mRNA interferase YafQ